MQAIAAIAKVTRPYRRRLTPSNFKETYINASLQAVAGDTLYVEIGVRQGESLRIITADRKIGVDPIRTPEMTSLYPGEEYFETTSNVFFSQHAAEVLEPRSVDAALVDGLHEFRQALADVLHLEPYMKPSGIIFMDDCNPHSETRAADTPSGGVWNGDVWKVAAFIQHERPDLMYATIDADEGVGLVMNFTGDRPQADASTITQYKGLTYAYLDSNRNETLNLIPSADFERFLLRRE